MRPCSLKYLILPVFYLVFILSAVTMPAQAEEFQPYYASFRASEVNLRAGPGHRYPIEWVYQQRHLPVYVIDQFDHWKQVRDHDGTTGWIHRSLLSDRQSVIVVQGNSFLSKKPTSDSLVVAGVEPGVVALVQECQYDWCLVETNGYEGWINKMRVWGVP